KPYANTVMLTTGSLWGFYNCGWCPGGMRRRPGRGVPAGPASWPADRAGAGGWAPQVGGPARVGGRRRWEDGRMTIPGLEVVQRTGSTNTDLLEMAGADPVAWPHLSVLLAREQTAGKGRAGRTWQSGDLWALTFSVVLRPRVDRQRWGWIPLVAGLAVVRT